MNMSFNNINDSQSYNMTVDTTLRALSGDSCSEIIVINRSGVDVNFYDNGETGADRAFILLDGESFSFKGVSHANSLSAQAQSGSGTIYYRTQDFSITPSR